MAVDNRGKWVSQKNTTGADSALASSVDYLPRDFHQDMNRFPHIRLLAGHSLKPYHEFESSMHELIWFTFLRDPVSRFVSHYIHQQTSSQKLYHMSLPDWCRNFQRNDFMVRMIAGEANSEKAIEILESKFAFVGLSEHFDQSMALLKEKLQLPTLNLNQRNPQKMAGRNDELKEEIYNNFEKYRECILANNQLDARLYQYAEQRFSRLASIGHESQSRSFRARISEAVNLFLFRFQDNVLYKPGKRGPGAAGK